MLSALRDWSNRYLSFLRPQGADQAQPAGDMSRDRRAATVETIRTEIHRIQHEISDLNDTMTADPAAQTSTQVARMAELHRDLARKQQELGKYQARI